MNKFKFGDKVWHKEHGLGVKIDIDIHSHSRPFKNLSFLLKIQYWLFRVIQSYSKLFN